MQRLGGLCVPRFYYSALLNEMPRKKQSTPSQPIRRSRRQAGQSPESLDEEQESPKQSEQTRKKTATKTSKAGRKTLQKSSKEQPASPIRKRSREENYLQSEEASSTRSRDPSRSRPYPSLSARANAWGARQRRTSKRSKILPHRSGDLDTPEFADVVLEDYSSSSDGESEDENMENNFEEDPQSEDNSQSEDDAQSEDGPSDSDLESESEEESHVKEDVSWGWKSKKARVDHPIVLRQTKKVQNWDHISLRFDPDSEKKEPVQGLIRYIVSRGYLFVVLPSLKRKNIGLERAVLVKGGEYPEAKQRFIDGGGVTVSSSDASCLANTDWQSFKMNNVATTLDGKMTLVEGYNDDSKTKEMKIVSISTLREAYGKAQADALTLLRRVSVGQTRLIQKNKKQNLPSDVMEFLTANRLNNV